ncbi:type II toxin-antitoxin system VapC family toxin [Halegenticoccus soli]|uniref:type II toxin-antitoxin system VapC family toxin n=1 Tax=Halegenticoccus soli TaxID=1985678 RepID=UPI000C6E1C6F|nr:type II toxin-antitoxin system VapC family toxin [Halegenticoccus soli]
MDGKERIEFERLLLDVNAIAIALLGDHPGHEYVFPYVQRGFAGESCLLVFDYFPFRAQYVLTKRYSVEPHRARNVVQRFLRQPLEIVSADREALLAAYEISAEKNHDVYDSVLISLARSHNADAILTTDADFDELCADETFQYYNPVPDSVLEQFRQQG